MQQPTKPTIYIAHHPSPSPHASVLVNSSDEFSPAITFPEYAYPTTLDVQLVRGLYVVSPTIWKNSTFIARFADGWQITVEKVVR